METKLFVHYTKFHVTRVVFMTRIEMTACVINAQ